MSIKTNFRSSLATPSCFGLLQHHASIAMAFSKGRQSLGDVTRHGGCGGVRLLEIRDEMRSKVNTSECLTDYLVNPIEVTGF